MTSPTPLKFDVASTTAQPHTRRAPTRAVRLTLALGLALIAMFALCLSWSPLSGSPDTDHIRLAIRATARTSLVFFLLAYTASAISVLWPGPGSSWLRVHRRQWGWLLVLSHTLHAIGIVSLAVTAPAVFAPLAPMGNRISGGLAYVILWGMGATSFDRSAAWIGPKAWSRLHTWGSHYLWLSFVVANGKRIAQQPAYLIPVLLLLAALALRWVASRKGARRAGIDPRLATSPPQTM